MPTQQDSLSWTDSSGNVYHYYQRPMMNAVILILFQEFGERVALYAIVPNAQAFLKEYLGYTDVQANSYIGVFQAILFVTPLIAAVLADSLLGIYATIMSFSLLYFAGLFILLLATIKTISSPWMIHLSLLVMITLGGGAIKACVNVMGAQQFHPEHHKDGITTYYTLYYGVINIGGMVGGLITPIVLQETNFTVAFIIPLVAFGAATASVLIGGLLGRFVKAKPQGSVVITILRVMISAIRKCSLEKNKKSHGGQYDDGFIEDVKALLRLVPLFCLIIPFMVAYNNILTAFLTQAQKMDRRTFNFEVPASFMVNVDPIAVVITSFLVTSVLYPMLRKRDIVIPVLVRCFIGTIFGIVSLVCAIIVELQIKSKPLFTVSVGWLIPQFWAVATGEVFLISTAYEVAFTFSPESLKAVASAVCLLFIAAAFGLSAVLFDLCSPWLPDFDPTHPSEVSQKGSHYEYFFLVLIALCIIGAVACLALIPYFKRINRAKHQVEVDKTSNGKD